MARFEREQGAPRRGTLLPVGLPALGWAVLAVTALMSAFWSQHKLLEQDEIFSLQTDRVASLREVLRIQAQFPISLEPPPYHVLAHAAMQVFGPTAWALRFPAWVGYLVMMACLFFFVRNLFASPLLGERAGLVAMAIPAVTSTLFYAAEGRPYGLMLGSYAAAMLSWQVAARRADDPQPRLLPLAGLAAALALTLNVHFYGVLLLVAICGAELARTLARRRPDWPMFGAIALGVASLAAVVPYARASAEFKKNYYAAKISTHAISQPYRQMLMDYTHYPKRVQSVLFGLILLLGLAVAVGCWRTWRTGLLRASAGETALVGLLLLLPVFAFVLGRAVTHALEVRHSMGALLAVCTLFGIACAPFLRRKALFFSVMAALLVAILGVNSVRAQANARADRQTLAAMELTPAQRSAVDAQPGNNVYFQDLGQWELASTYEPDPTLRRHLVLVYSLAEEMRFEQHDTMYLTAVHTGRFDPAPIVSYDALRRQPGDHLFVVFHGSGWSWTDQAFASEAAEVQSLGPAFGGELVRVHFR